MAEENIYNGVTIERSWSLVAFAKENGLPKFREDINKETGEVEKINCDWARIKKNVSLQIK